MFLFCLPIGQYNKIKKKKRNKTFSHHRVVRLENVRALHQISYGHSRIYKRSIKETIFGNGWRWFLDKSGSENRYSLALS